MDKTIKLTHDDIHNLDFSECDNMTLLELAAMCVRHSGDDNCAVDTAYFALRNEWRKVDISDILRGFGTYIQQEFNQLKDNYLHVCKRDDWLLSSIGEMYKGKCLVGIDKDLKLMFCYYKPKMGKFYDGLNEEAKEVHPIAFFKNINPQALFNLINDNE